MNIAYFWERNGSNKLTTKQLVMRYGLVSTGILFLGFSLSVIGQERPNVIFIMSDDMNDWAGPFGGNPQISTPHMDKFADAGAMVFANTHVPGPVCGPSRSALLSGFRPETSGVYSNDQNMLLSELVQQHATLPEYFSKHGYMTISRGKIFHSHFTENGVDQGQWAFDIWESNEGSFAVQKDKLYSRYLGVYNGEKQENMKHGSNSAVNDLTWAPTVQGKEGTPDYKTALWFAEQLQKDYDKPFFMAVGIFRPHLPWHVPQEYFDRYGLDTLKIPEFRLDDLDDILTPSGKLRNEPRGEFQWLLQDEGLFKQAVRAYMASISYADDCIGVVLDALENSKYRENTIVVIMGDHGWHLGEKLRFGKATLWSESTRTPLMIRTPDMNRPAVSKRVVNLMDLYPTLIELCDLPEKSGLDGRSLVPLLKKPSRKWPYPSITTLNRSFTVNDEGWRYTRYSDGTEELYNLREDPMEWNNLITSDNPEALTAKDRLEKWLPALVAEPVPSDLPKYRQTGKREPDMTLKAGRSLDELK
jgi:arylsulfatase A-like enzyme